MVGKTLANHLGLELVDTDQILEGRVGSTIPGYVAENGWDAFRMLEKIIIRSISNYDQRVISTGGGAVLDWENVRNLRKTGWLVWLRTSISTIRDRMTQDENSGRIRPGLVGENPMAEIEQLLSERAPLYERACHYVVNTDEQSLEALAYEIIQSMPEPVMPIRDNGQPRETVGTAALNL